MKTVILLYRQNRNAADRTCPYCRASFRSLCTVVQCPACDTFYHIECWSLALGCSVFGCQGHNLPLPPSVLSSLLAPLVPLLLAIASWIIAVQIQGRHASGILDLGVLSLSVFSLYLALNSFRTNDSGGKDLYVYGTSVASGVLAALSFLVVLL